MKESTALVIGATGLIGSELVKILCETEGYTQLVALVRKWNGPSHPKLKVIVVSFDEIKAMEQAIPEGQTVFCCVGTTQRKVSGDLNAYRKVDFDIAVNTARIARAKNYQKYMLMSSVGANKNASNFYLRLKGEVEEAIVNVGFKHTGIFRPSVLIGPRPEKRIGESVGAFLTKLLSVFLQGGLSKYRAIQAATVARAMFKVSLQDTGGVEVYHYKEIQSAQ